MDFGGTSPPEDLELPADFDKTPLCELNHSTRRKIALHMNLEVVFNDEIGLEPNFRGLAELVQFSALEIRNLELPSIRSPTDELLDQWSVREDLSPTVGNLWNSLKQLERLDVLSEVWPFVERDCKKYLARQAIFKSRNESQQPVQDNSISQSSSSVAETVQDVMEPGKPKMFDAFVCYNPEGEDLQFVLQLIRVLEDENNLRLFVPWRDDLSGMSRDTICAQLIEKRCRRMIIVLSPRFLESSSCEFQINFAHTLSPGARDKKLVPIIIERCQVPEILRHVTCCDYTRKDVLNWFWKRVVCSIKADLNINSQLVTYENPRKLESLNFMVSQEVNWSDVSICSSTASSSSSSSSSSGNLDSLSSTGSSNSNMSHRTSEGRSLSSSYTRSEGRSLQSSPCVSSSPLKSANSDYEQIGNVGKSRATRFKEFVLGQKKRPVPPIPSKR